jgi:hypothetical protein
MALIDTLRSSLAAHLRAGHGSYLLELHADGTGAVTPPRARPHRIGAWVEAALRRLRARLATAGAPATPVSRTWGALRSLALARYGRALVDPVLGPAPPSPRAAASAPPAEITVATAAQWLAAVEARSQALRRHNEDLVRDAALAAGGLAEGDAALPREVLADVAARLAAGHEAVGRRPFTHGEVAQLRDAAGRAVAELAAGGERPLKPAQASRLHAFACDHGLDAAQCRALRALAGRFGADIARLGYDIKHRRPVAAFDVLRRMHDGFERDWREIAGRAPGTRSSRRLEDAALRLCTELAIAGEYGDGDKARRMYLLLAGAAAPGEAPAPGRLSRRETVRLLLQACAHAASPALAALPARYARIVLAFARHAGVDVDEPRDDAPARASRAPEHRVLARIAGEDVPLERLPVDLLARVMLAADDGTDGGAARVAASRLDVDRLPDAWTDDPRELPTDGDSALARPFVDALGGMDLRIDGVPVVGTAGCRLQAYREHFEDSGLGLRAAALVSRHLDPRALDRWREALHAAGAARPVQGAPAQAAFEIRADDDGGLRLSATFAQAAARRDEAGETTGVAVSELVFEIPAATIADGHPAVTRRRARAVFAR